MTLDRLDFEAVQDVIVRCRLCPRLVAWREKTAREKVRRFAAETYWGRPVPAFGAPTAALLVVGLAPAAHGANRTGRMFTGDSSGDWLFHALHLHGFADSPASRHAADGLALKQCLITAALRCAPPANKPTSEELHNCSRYLQREMQLLESVRVVVVLGGIAFRAFLRAWRANGSHTPIAGQVRFCHGGVWRLGEKLTLISSYHPSRQNTQTKRLTRQMFHEVFQTAREILRGSGT